MVLVELFAGVGGFRLGFEGHRNELGQFLSSTSRFSKPISHEKYFITGFSNQYEPLTKRQHASEVYVKQFGQKGHSNENITKIHAKDILQEIELSAGVRSKEDLVITGGFPCQDYSVGTLLKNSKGLNGKKGILWWEIYRIIKELTELNRKPKYLVLENVDRLLKSPVYAKGSDFATILYCLASLDYNVEYQTITASDFGFPQKRSRVFIVATDNRYPFRDILKEAFKLNINDLSKSVFHLPTNKNLQKGLVEMQSQFRLKSKQSPFKDSGSMLGSVVTSFKSKPEYNGHYVKYKDIKLDETKFHIEDFYNIHESDLSVWRNVKQAKKILRFKPNGIPYKWSEGNMELLTDYDKPLRTIITSEIGKTPARNRHLIEYVLNGKRNYRRLHPIELERANMFPDNFTDVSDFKPSKRGFLMGNALVVGIVELIRNIICEIELENHEG
jgi:DNA (cytosine-5)-methyltransferase 1